MQFPTNNSIWPQALLLDKGFAKAVPDCEIFELENGMRVVLMTDDKDRSTTMKVLVNAGAIHQSPSLRGLPHFVEHSVFRGTKVFEDNEALIAFGEDFNLSYNASTSHNEQQFYVVSDNDDESLDAAALMLSQILLHPTFPAEAVDIEREIITGERQASMSDPNRVSYEAWANHFYNQQHPYGGGGVIGEFEAIGNITRKDLIDFYSKYFKPENMVLVVTGGRDSSYYRDLISKYFNEGNKSEGWTKNPLSESKRETEKKDSFIEKDFKHINLYTGYFLARPEVVSYPSTEYFSMRVLQYALSMRVFLELRERQGLAYYVRAMSSNLSNTGYFFGVEGEFAVNKYDKARIEMERSLAEIISKPVEVKEFNRAMRRFKSTRWANSVSKLASSIADQLFTIGQPVSPEAMHPWLEKLDLDNVNRIGAGLLSNAQMETIAVGPLSEVEKK